MIYPCEALDKKYSKQSSSNSRGVFEKEGESGTYALKQKRGRAMEKGKAVTAASLGKKPAHMNPSPLAQLPRNSRVPRNP